MVPLRTFVDLSVGFMAGIATGACKVQLLKTSWMLIGASLAGALGCAHQRDLGCSS